MAKKKDMVLVGYPMYKCRLCGKSFTEQYTIVEDTYQDVQGPHGMEVWRYRLHFIDPCKDGAWGVADFQGLVGLRFATPATENSWGEHLDPASKQPIPLRLERTASE